MYYQYYPAVSRETFSFFSLPVRVFDKSMSLFKSKTFYKKLRVIGCLTETAKVLIKLCTLTGCFKSLVAANIIQQIFFRKGAEGLVWKYRFFGLSVYHVRSIDVKHFTLVIVGFICVILLFIFHFILFLFIIFLLSLFAMDHHKDQIQLPVLC